MASTRIPREVRERDMLRVATRVFSERGFHAASMDEIASGAGISKPMVYAYFGSKEGLYVASIRAAGEQLRDEIARGADADVPPDEQMWQGSLAFFTFVGRQPEGWRVLYREASVQGGPSAAEVAELRREIVLLTARSLARSSGAPVEEMEALASGVVGAGESMANWWVESGGSLGPERLAEQLMNLVWMGLGDLHEGRRWRP
jgi:AcrR family transcriptional regulator